MDLIFRELFCKVDNYYGVKRTLPDTNTTSRAQILGYYSFAVTRALDNTLSTSLVYWTVDNAFQATFFWLA